MPNAAGRPATAARGARRALLAAAAALAAPAARPLAAQGGAPGPRAPTPLPRVTPAVRALAGCYRLTVRQLGDPEGRRGREDTVPLPPVVRLDTVAQRTFGRRPDFRAAPDITTYRDLLPFAPGWLPAGRDSLRISWFDGLSGSTLRLRRTGAG